MRLLCDIAPIRLWRLRDIVLQGPGYSRWAVVGERMDILYTYLSPMLDYYFLLLYSPFFLLNITPVFASVPNTAVTLRFQTSGR